MQNYFQFALQKLQNSGLKITRQRSMILHFLAQSKKALSPYEMKELLKTKKIKADVVTMYRVLDLLEKLELVHKVQVFHGYIACEAPATARNVCHHYLLCEHCHAVNEVKGEDLKELEKKIAREHKFSIQSHYLEFRGICAACEEKL